SSGTSPKRSGARCPAASGRSARRAPRSWWYSSSGERSIGAQNDRTETAQARPPPAGPLGRGAFPFTFAPAVHPGPEAPPHVDESELIARVLRGEPEAFHALFERHSPPILATLRSAVRSREDALEILQETWLRAFERLAELRDPGRLRAWLLSIALNLARERSRREREAVELPGELAGPEPAGEDLERDEELSALRRELAGLPARQREVVDLRVNHELSHAEIARQLSITEEASRA